MQPRLSVGGLQAPPLDGGARRTGKYRKERWAAFTLLTLKGDLGRRGDLRQVSPHLAPSRAKSEQGRGKSFLDI